MSKDNTYKVPEVDYLALEVGDVVVEADGSRVRYIGAVEGVMRWELVREEADA